ncbi:DEAD/DEAH box helicase [Corynebacterium sp. CCM 9186]|uniref:DEAD/DEAH box helicase n=1 Tax=Corynebacterium meridianum TaxID=2765363 RepID=UPI002004811D|nr:DEAD/DEAH box helicase [Corynebacterium meridianum]MCK7678176.1 DEAD/DEAH box helicase [Corynebacterium meridianum]
MTSTPTHLVHGLWCRETGFHLWIEQVEGHRVVGPDSVPNGTLPVVLEVALAGRPFRHRIPVVLQTPKQRRVSLTVPTAAFTPAQAVELLAQLAPLDQPGPAVPQLQRAAVAPDLLWLIRLYLGLERFVRAGRVSLRCRWDDGQWWPEWQLIMGTDEAMWLTAMAAAAPRILTVNASAAVAEEVAGVLPHWIALAYLADVDLATPDREPHPFVRALLAGEAFHRGNARLVAGLTEWRGSLDSEQVELVFVVEEPATADRDQGDTSPSAAGADRVIELSREPAARRTVTALRGLADTTDRPPAGDEPVGELWRVGVRVRKDGGTPEPFRRGIWPVEIWQKLSARHQRAVRISGLLDDSRFGITLRGDAAGEDDGDWDVALTGAQILTFIEKDAEALRKEGFLVMLPASWSRQEVGLKVSTSFPQDPGVVGSTHRRFGLDQIVEYDWRLSLGDTVLEPEEMAELVNSRDGLIKLRGNWVVADGRSVARVAKYVSQLVRAGEGHLREEVERRREALATAKMSGTGDIPELEKALAEAERAYSEETGTSGVLSAAELRKLALENSTEDDTPVEFTATGWHARLMGDTAGTGDGDPESTVPEQPAPVRVAVPDTVHAELRPYQRRGVDWLHWMSRAGLGAVLADDMGLGKTLQLLTLTAVEKAETEHGRGGEFGPTLIVAPNAVLANWAAEARRFVPSLRVIIHHGGSRLKGDAFSAAVEGADIVITSYGTATRDRVVLSGIGWWRVVLDEAQHIKNSATGASRAVRAIPSRHRVALTGTPVENRLSELRSIMDYCNPGVLGSANFFRNHYANAIEKYGDEEMSERLRTFTAPFILRRVKTDPAVIDDLPEKNETILRVPMTAEQAALYQSYVNNVKEKLAGTEATARRGLVLAAITRTKQICNHPAHYLGDGSPVSLRGRHRSGKVAALMDLLDETTAAGERTIVFTQYRAFGTILAPYLSSRLDREIPFLHGGLSRTRRDRMVADFQSPDGPPVMIVSLKAGGTGLNLTAANVVVHMDRWWNPAVENQATDRAYRIGQLKDVRVYMMVTEGTIEESIQEVLEGKRRLAGTVISGGEGWITELSDDELAELFSYRDRVGARGSRAADPPTGPVTLKEETER